MDRSIAQALVHATSLLFEKGTERQGLMQFSLFPKLAVARRNGVTL